MSSDKVSPIYCLQFSQSYKEHSRNRVEFFRSLVNAEVYARNNILKPLWEIHCEEVKFPESASIDYIVSQLQQMLENSDFEHLRKKKSSFLLHIFPLVQCTDDDDESDNETEETDETYKSETE